MQYCKDVASSELLEGKKLEALRKKRNKTHAEHLQERKGNIASKYCLGNDQINEELVKRDDEGFYMQCVYAYYLTDGKDYLSIADELAIAELTKTSKGKVFRHDVNRKQLSARITGLKVLKIKQFLDPDKTFTKQELEEWFELICHNTWEIKALFGMTVNPEKDSGITVAQRFLAKLGCKLKYVGQSRKDGERVRTYAGVNLQLDVYRKQIFKAWIERDDKRQKDMERETKESNQLEVSTA